MPTLSLELEVYLIAYIDVLGARNKMLGAQKVAYLNKIHGCMKSSEDKIRELSTMVGIESRIKVFSDNVCIAVKNDPTSEYTAFEYSSLINYLCTFSGLLQQRFLEEGELVRGAITQGELFIDERIIYGPALIRAHDMESRLSKYPRIIIDKRLLPQAKPFLDGHLCKKHNWRDLAILAEDYDGELYLDYLGYVENNHVFENIENLCISSFAEIEECISNTTDDKVLQKYAWHKNYLIKTMKDWPDYIRPNEIKIKE